MSLDALPPLRLALAEAGILADKRFGQHFLLDLNICRKIVRLSGIGPDETVLEVGPGPGGLTRALLETGARVVAIEKDPRFRPLLDEVAAASGGRLTIVQADALKVDEASLAAGPAAVVANLPYNVGTPLLVKWLTGPFRSTSMTLMFQKEVALRIVAQPGEEHFGRLAVLSQALCEARLVMDLPARAFTPAAESRLGCGPARTARRAARRLPGRKPADRRTGGFRSTAKDAALFVAKPGRRSAVRAGRDRRQPTGRDGADQRVPRAGGGADARRGAIGRGRRRLPPGPGRYSRD